MKGVWIKNGGKPNAPMIGESLSDWLSRMANPTANGCLNWKGFCARSGHGQVRYKGQDSYGAHRLAFEMAYGPIPEGRWILHKCDNGSCVNPEHLYAGDHAQNMKDRDARGRTASRARNGSAKLSESIVTTIRERRASEGLSLGELSKLFDISKSQIARIVRAQSWN